MTAVKNKIRNVRSKRKYGLISVSVIVVVLSGHASTEMEIRNSYQLIHDHLSKIHSVDRYKNATNARNQKQELPDIVLSPGERRSILLQNFARIHHGRNDILTRQSVKGLYILSGTPHKPRQSLLGNIGPTMTVTGEIMLANLLISPTVDVTVLQKRQQALQYLLDHPKLIFQIEEYLIHYAADEDGLVALLDPADVINSPYFDDINYQTSFPGLTTSATHEEVARRLNDSINIIGALNVPLGLIGSTFLGIFDTRYGVVQGVLDATIGLPSNMNRVISEIHHNFDNLSLPVKIFTLGSFALLQVIAIYKSYRLFQDNQAAYTFIMERSRRPGRALESAKELEQLIRHHPVLGDILDHYGGFAKLRSSTQVQELVTLLEGAPEKTPDTFTYLATNMGRYKRGLVLLRRNSRTLLPVMQAVGEIDAWLTVAKLLRSASYRSNNPLSFAQYEVAREPVVQLHGFWNPLLSADVAVPGDLNTELSSNIIITGPNAAGKSTAINGIALNVLLAQTLGICAAVTFRLTPFAFIHTHKFTEPENISGTSSFSAESKRTIALLQKLQALQTDDDASPGRLSIVFLDEIFSNTSPREGELGAITYMQALGSFPRSVSISSTHYQQLATLAERYPGTFQNLHVSAEIGVGGSLHYDYVLKPGFSGQNVAFDILREEGMQQDFLDRIKALSPPDQVADW